MTTSLSIIGHPIGGDPSATSAANTAMARVVAAGQTIRLEGVDLVLRQFHVAGGWFLAGSQVSRHEHAEIQLEIPLSGRFVFRTDDGDWPLSAGEALFMAPAVPHSWVCEDTSVMIGVLLHLGGPRAGEFADWLGGAVERRTVTYRSAALQDDLLRAVRLLTETPRPVWHGDRLAALVSLIVAEVIAGAVDLSSWQPRAPIGEPGEARAVEACKRAVEFIHANYAHPIGIPDVAIHTGVSPRHLSRLFRRHQKQTINQLLLRVRLQRALSLLEQRLLTVKEVAFACGFASPAYFTQCFRRQYGRLPTDVQADRAPQVD